MGEGVKCPYKMPTTEQANAIFKAAANVGVSLEHVAKSLTDARNIFAGKRWDGKEWVKG
jgi:hypothetical protein